MNTMIPKNKNRFRRAAFLFALAGILAMSATHTTAQTTKTWEWAHSGKASEVPSTVGKPALDKAENIYLGGHFRSPGEVMQFSNSTMTLTEFNPDIHTIFLAKYDKEGALLWAKSFKSGMTSGEMIAVDSTGNIYCTASYKDSIRFGTTVLSNPSGLYYQFMAKFNTNGDLVWARNLPTAASGYYFTFDVLEITAGQRLYLAGSFNQATASFDGNSISNSNSAGGSYDYFLTELNTQGDIVWATAGGTPALQDFAFTMCGNKDGDLYLGTAYQDTGVVVNGGQINLYKYNSTGTISWTESINSTSGIGLYAMTCDSKNNLYLAGNYGGTAQFDGLTLDEEGGGCYTVKYDHLGNALWARSSKGNAVDVTVFATGIGVDESGTVSIGGSFTYSLLTPVTTVTFDTTTLTLEGSRDAFFVQYNSSGALLTARKIGSIYSEFGSGLRVVPNGNVYFSGSFYSPEVQLDSVSLINTPDPDDNYYGKFFLAKFTELPTTGIDKTPGAIQLSLYPNPSDGLVHLSTAGHITALRITDVSGRQLYTRTFTGRQQHATLDLRQYARGHYYLHLVTDRGTGTRTITLR